MMTAQITPDEILALLVPEPPTRGQPAKMATAVVRDPQGGLMLQSVVPNRALLKRALIAVRANDGTPILDPVTREVIGYELAPLAVA
ncbi:MAG TPA: hypothetical protein VFI92_02605 [Steroidobacteraceae bacterium]|nr:hypothetical protein [Steroidobacteraceae bacterium]